MIKNKEREAFIAEVAPYAVKAYKELGKVKPSVAIGMACVESRNGTSKVMRKYNNFTGHKVGTGRTAKKYWDGGFFNAKTSEEYQVGVHTVIRDNFRSYKSMEQNIFNFYELLNTSLYAKVKADADYATQMKQIKAVGYMTSSTEVDTVIQIIKDYNLVQYDYGDVAVLHSTIPAECKVQPNDVTYTIVRGDNLTKISNKFQTPIWKLIAINKAKYPRMTRNYIQAGWIIKVR